VIVRDNRGYDPIGELQPSIPASGVQLSSAYDCMVYMNVKPLISSFTITIVGTNGVGANVSISVPSTVFRLPAGALLTLTYGAPPLNSWLWFCN
jgi:hypothetical protein